MKKIVSIFILVFTFSINTKAQDNPGKKDIEKLSVEQQTNLQVKKMTLKLDLTEAQQRQIKPLIAQKIEAKKVMRERRKEMKENGKKREKLSAETRYNLHTKKLDKMIAFKADMKRILNEKQFEKFEKMADRKIKKGKHKRKKRAKKVQKQ